MRTIGVQSWQQFFQSRLPSCPVCGENIRGLFVEGEFVDVGVGHVKCSPDICDRCGYEEVGSYCDETRHNSRIEYVRDCVYVEKQRFGTGSGAD